MVFTGLTILMIMGEALPKSGWLKDEFLRVVLVVDVLSMFEFGSSLVVVVVRTIGFTVVVVKDL